MIRQLPAILAMTVVLAGGTAVCQTKIIVNNNRMVVGGYFSSGFAMVGGDGYEDWTGWDRNDRTAKYAVGGGAYFDFFFTQYFGIEAGLGFLNKGIRFRDGDERSRLSFVYMEIPIMAKLDIKHFQAAAGLAFSVALSGKSTDTDGSVEVKERWGGDEWRYYHRVNLGPKITLGYAIPVGPVSIVPGMSWTMHLINDLNNDEIENIPGFPDNTNYRARANNLMFNVGVEWVLP